MNRESHHRRHRGLRSWGIAVAISALLALVPAAAGAVPTKPQRPVCPGPASGASALCHAHVVTDHRGTPLASTSPTGYGPAKFHGAYNLPSTSPVAQTIAIVDAYDDPTIASDLNHYSAYYGLPQCNTSNPCFQKVNQSGVAGSYPAKNAGWALEIALDVETAHQICQNCKILLVEATSNSFSNLAAAVNTAARLGASQISNSYGGGEWSGETSISAFDHPGVAVTASSGDSGYGAEYPAASPSVVAVGGTTLSVGTGNTWAGETAWSGAGSGCSSYAAARSWQTADPGWSLTGCGTKRGIADVAADANPSTGAAVYDTTRYQGRSGWFQVGGTSLSAPLVAGVYALAADGYATGYPASLAYQNRGQLHDVTGGSNGSCGTVMCKAGPGYDGPTGLGTPNGLGAF
jgi:subtilase family serine protease